MSIRGWGAGGAGRKEGEGRKGEQTEERRKVKEAQVWKEELEE